MKLSVVKKTGAVTAHSTMLDTFPRVIAPVASLQALYDVTDLGEAILSRAFTVAQVTRALNPVRDANFDATRDAVYNATSTRKQHENANRI